MLSTVCTVHAFFGTGQVLQFSRGQSQAMAGQRPFILPAFVLLASAFCTWFSVRQSGAAFTVTGASPLGFPPPAQSPRAEIPSAPEAGALGGSKAPGDVEVMYRRYDHLARKDMGYKFPVGEEAYQFPPPIPQPNAGLRQPTWFNSHCDRVYRRKYKVCQRLKENKRRRSDCEYDAFRWRRSCYWRGRQYKIHPNFYEKHAWHKSDDKVKEA